MPFRAFRAGILSRHLMSTFSVSLSKNSCLLMHCKHGISFRNGQVFREVSCNLFLQTDSIFPNNDFFLNANSNYFDIFAQNKVIMPQSAITIRLDSDLKAGREAFYKMRQAAAEAGLGFKTCRLTRFCKDFA